MAFRTPFTATSSRTLVCPRGGRRGAWRMTSAPRVRSPGSWCAPTCPQQSPGTAALSRSRGSGKLLIHLNGEMSEWLKEHAWKACVGETLPRVRIPLSPPSISSADKTGEVPERSNGAVSKTVDRATGPWVRIPPSPPFVFTGGRASLTPLPSVDYLTGFVPIERAAPDGPAVPRSMTSISKKAAHSETDLSAQQSPAQADARLPGAHAHPSRPGGDRPAAPQGTPSPE